MHARVLCIYVLYDMGFWAQHYQDGYRTISVNVLSFCERHLDRKLLIAEMLKKTRRLTLPENPPSSIAVSPNDGSRRTYSSYNPVTFAPSTLHTLNVPLAPASEAAYPVPNITQSSTTAMAPWKDESRSQVLSMEPVCLSSETRLPIGPLVTGPEGV